MTNVKRIFTVNGKPFYPLGAQADNLSGQSASESEKSFKVVQKLHGNTLEIPVYWEQVEPEEGKFDFTSVDALLANARKYGLKLILLWFATWKNANMDYAPAWVKTNPQRFKRVLSATGIELWILSSHCKANLEADKKAFTALCKYLKAKDSTEQTVIGIQVENEPGIIGSDRDYGPEAQSEFDSPVPAKLVTAMKAAGDRYVYNIWQQAGGIKSGSWSELFGWEAGEFLSAWSIARYIDSVAAAGKAVYNIPMFINVWLRESRLWALPGVNYPSGGSVHTVLDIYKWLTPHIDLIGPDIYLRDAKAFWPMCADYSREDNPFFLPESGPELTDNGESCQPWGIFRAIAEYNLIGYFFFGAEFIAYDDCTFRPQFWTLIDSIRCIESVIPLLLKYKGTGKIHAVMQEETYMKSQELDMDGYLGLIHFGDGRLPFVTDDLRLPEEKVPADGQPAGSNRGRGLIIQASRNEFYLVGARYRFMLRRKQTSSDKQSPLPIAESVINNQIPYLSVDEGHFDKNGKYIIDRRRSGGPSGHRVTVEPDHGVIRVIMSD